MTAAEVDAAIKAEGLAWNILDGSVVDLTALHVPAFSTYCNTVACATYSKVATDQGLTPKEFADILRLHVGDPRTDPPTHGDSTQLRALLSA